MALPNYTFIEGFDKYTFAGDRGQLDVASVGSILTSGEWTSWSRDATTGTQSITSALTGDGSCFRQFAGTATVYTLYKTLGVSLPRIIGGMTWQADSLTNTASYAGISFLDGSTGQIAISFNSIGQVVVKRGAITSSTILGTSTLSYSFGVPLVIEWDIVFSNTAGSIKIYFNGVADPALTLTGIDTCGSSNDYANRIGLLAGNNADHRVDHLYIWGYLATGGSETPALTNPVVQTSYATANVSVEMTPIADTVGDAISSSFVGGTTVSPGANQLVLRRFVAGSSGNLDSVSMKPDTTSAGALLKAVVYSDNVGGTAPDALIAVGTEVTGTTAGTPKVMPFGSAVAVTAGTAYWVGYITNTSLNVYPVNSSLLGYRANNTYTSGAPNPAPAMTSGQTSWAVWGDISSPTQNWSAVSHSPFGGSAAYVQSATVGAQDLYDFNDLTSSPSAIYTVAVKALVNKTDTGVRTLNLRAKSGAVTSSGSNSNQALLTTDYFYSSYFNTDPNTGLAWTPTDVDLASFGYQINS